MKGPIPHDMELLPRTAQPAFNSWGLPLRQITVTLYHCVCWQNKLFILSCLDILANSCIFYALLLDFVWMGCIGIGIRFGWSSTIIWLSLHWSASRRFHSICFPHTILQGLKHFWSSHLSTSLDPKTSTVGSARTWSRTIAVRIGEKTEILINLDFFWKISPETSKTFRWETLC